MKVLRQEETGPLEKLEEGVAEASGAGAGPGGSLREVRKAVDSGGVRQDQWRKDWGAAGGGLTGPGESWGLGWRRRVSENGRVWNILAGGTA